MNITVVKSKGFSLVEVLFALFIFSVGLLGIAGLQIVAKQNSFDAVQRTTAALLASEIAEKIRANPAQGARYVASVTNLPTATLPTTNCSSAAPCTPENLASYDLKIWYQAILGASKVHDGNSAGGLVSPSACITEVTETIAGVTTTVGYTIAIAWRGKTPLANPTANTCGQDPAVYGTGNAYRRLLVFSIAV
jgi:type IV pilus assembly protein PilV